MNLWQTMTGSDLTREWKAFEARAEALPTDYRAAWGQIKVHLREAVPSSSLVYQRKHAPRRQRNGAHDRHSVLTRLNS
jgi:hypothetical protein